MGRCPIGPYEAYRLGRPSGKAIAPVARDYQLN